MHEPTASCTYGAVDDVADASLPARAEGKMRTMDIRGIVGANVRRVRRDAGLTQEQLADATGMPRATIVRIEKGHREARVSTLLAIAHALKRPLACLLAGLPEQLSDDNRHP